MDAPVYQTDPTALGDQIAEMMREHYEAHKPLRWWQRRRKRESCVADDLMIGLQNIAIRAHEEARAERIRAEALRWRG